MGISALLSLVTVFSGTAAFASGMSPVNDFGLRLLREAHQVDGGGTQAKNTMISPVSAHMALSMAANGAGGMTQALLLRDLGVASVDELNSFNQQCAERLVAAGGDAGRRGVAPAVFNLANGAWESASERLPTFAFNQEFKDLLSRFFKARAGRVDFESSETESLMNDWVKEQTNGLIPKLVTAQEIRDLVFLLINTAYFQGSWAVDFHPVRGAASPTFTTAAGVAKSAPMIHAQAHLRYRNDGAYEAIEIPFVSGAGRQFVFYVVLPAVGSEVNFVQPEFWQELMRARDGEYPALGDLTMPKFAFDYAVSMTQESDLTAAMGLAYLFSDRANFLPMATPDSHPAKVGLIKQVTRIELDENGVKAAAATAVGGIFTTSVPMPQFNMVVNRPFSFAIAEKNSGALLFVGQVVDP